MGKKTVTINPVTRIEGHGKITLQLDENGHVTQARFHVTDFRGFEKFCEQRPFWEMPDITSRICGICPVSHMLASAKAGDAILGVHIPAAAHKLRRLIHWAQLVQSHALSFFHLSAPDLLLGMDSDPRERNILGLVAEYPAVAKDGIRLRQVGQEIIRVLGGKRVHPSWAVPGGVRSPLKPENLEPLQAMIPEALEIADRTLNLYRGKIENISSELEHYGDFPSLHVGLVGLDGELEHYDGMLRVMDAGGKILENGVRPETCQDVFSEEVEPWSYLKFPCYKPFGPEKGLYRVGPLARLNVCDRIGTPRADRALKEFHRWKKDGRPVSGSFHMHEARLIEILFSLEKIAETLSDPHITSTHVRSHAGVNARAGVGVIEAPRGTLFHDYHVDEEGLVREVNLVVASGHNNLAMNRTILQIAQAFGSGIEITEGFLNRMEHGIRIYDPCLSCSTHLLGRHALRVEYLGPSGELLRCIEML